MAKKRQNYIIKKIIKEELLITKETMEWKNQVVVMKHPTKKMNMHLMKMVKYSIN